ncbi:MAG: MFS transporter [Patescibacteria group bacterium]
MSNLFPHSKLRNIRIFYLLSIFTNAWFALPNWMFLFNKYVTKPEIGFIDAFAILLGISLEIPTGLISDVFGKKRTLILGNTLLAMGSLTIAFSTTFSGFLIGNCITFVGFAFNSGSLEAFAYDSLVEKGKEKDYDQVVSKSTSLAIGMSFLSVFAGGFLFSIDARLPFLAATLTSVFCIPILFFSTEPVIDTEHVTVQNSLSKLRDGMTTIFSLRFRDILIPILVIVSLAKLHQGVVRQSMAAYYSFNGETFGYVLAITMIPALFIVSQFDKIRKKLGTQNLMMLTLGGYALLFLFGANTQGTIPGIAYFIVLMTWERVAYQIMTVSANERIASGHRATALSVLALISQVPYVVIMFFFASWTEPAQIPFLILGFSAIAVATTGFTFYEMIRTPPKSL